jgi:hypothetical protein
MSIVVGNIPWKLGIMECTEPIKKDKHKVKAKADAKVMKKWTLQAFPDGDSNFILTPRVHSSTLMRLYVLERFFYECFQFHQVPIRLSE